MGYIFLITFLVISAVEAIYLWLKWDKIKSLISAIKTLNQMVDITKVMGMSNHPAINNKRVITRVAIFMSNYIETTWLWVTILLVMNMIISLLFSSIISLLILIIS